MTIETVTDGAKAPFIWGSRFRQPRNEPVILRDSSEVAVTQPANTALAPQQRVAPPSSASRPTGNKSPLSCLYLRSPSSAEKPEIPEIAKLS